MSIARILVHGGAGAWASADTAGVIAQILTGVKDAAAEGWQVLKGGGSALDAIEAAVMILEDNPLYDAGVGSYLNQNGEVEMDALIADGDTLKFGAVAAIQQIQHPISLARMVMTHTDHCFMVAEGAERLAASLGMPLVPNISFVTDDRLRAFRQWMQEQQPVASTGTVGAVAEDSHGRVAAATSTGGTAFKRKGRVGDTPIFGAGGYADVKAAASGTGRGEHLMRTLLCKYAVDQVTGGQPAPQAAINSMEYLSSRIADSNAGLILVDAEGKLGAAHTTAAMPVAWIDDQGQIQAAMRPNGLF